MFVGFFALKVLTVVRDNLMFLVFYIDMRSGFRWALSIVRFFGGGSPACAYVYAEIFSIV